MYNLPMKIYLPQPIFDTLENNHSLSQWSTMPEPVFPSHLPELARDDFKQMFKFLFSYRGSEATYNAYRREIERLAQWSWFVANKLIKDLKREDIEAFIQFCQNPPKTWIALKHVNRFIEENSQRIPNPEWRPFVVTLSKKAHKDGIIPELKNYALSQKALQAIFSVLSTFYNFLIQENYIAINPIAQIRQKSKFIRKIQGKTPIRRLSELQWSYVIETAEIMAKENPEIHERTLFMMTALFAMYLRISELATTSRWQPQMGHFFRDLDGNWWFKTVGKGNKERDITVSDAMLGALKRYRTSLNLTALPSPNEATPLLPKSRGKGAIMGTRHIRRIVQACFDAAIARLQNDGFNQEADMLMSATVHWLRHTGISEDVKHRPREHVRDDAGHGSSMITDRYIDIELRARHASGRKKVVKPLA